MIESQPARPDRDQPLSGSERRRYRSVAAVTVGGLVVLAAGCGPAEAPSDVARPFIPAPATAALAVGDRLPPLTAQGWHNGPPPAADAPGVKLLVVDVWAAWCPLCREVAPGLVRLQARYADRGVKFVSLSNMAGPAVQDFVNEFSVSWPSGYGAPAETVAALGVSSGLPTPGYEITPTVYLVGPDGRVRWSDQRGRYRHVQRDTWERNLDEAIRAALAGPAPAK